jgi:hypothetical protein
MQLNNVEFDSVDYKKVNLDNNLIFFELTKPIKSDDFLLKMISTNRCQSNIVRIKPVWDLDSTFLKSKGSFVSFLPEWIAVENVGFNQSSELYSGVKAPSVNYDETKKLDLLGFLTMKDEEDCINSLGYTEISEKSRNLFSYSLLFPKLNLPPTEMYFFSEWRNKFYTDLKILASSLNLAFESKRELKPFPLNSNFICSDSPIPKWENPKFSLFDLSRDYQKFDSKLLLSGMEIGCPTQGSLLSYVQKFSIGDLQRNQVILVESSVVSGNFLVVLVNVSESLIFKSTEILKTTSIVVPTNGVYDLHLIQVLDDQNSTTFSYPTVKISISENVKILKNFSRLLPKY